MSRKKSDRQADALAREAEEAADRMALFEFDQRMTARAELDQQRRQQFLTQARDQIAADRAEAEQVGLANYRQQAIAAALSSKALAPQVAAMIPAGLTSREDVDNFVQLGVAKTAEIVVEISSPTGDSSLEATKSAAERPRDITGRFISSQAEPQLAERGLPAGLTADELAKIQAGTYSLEDHARMRDRAGFGRRDAGLFG
jgi:restriction endonuclease Mrr